jgi:hypothetical protein
MAISAVICRVFQSSLPIPGLSWRVASNLGCTFNGVSAYSATGRIYRLPLGMTLKTPDSGKTQSDTKDGNHSRSEYR